MNFERRDKMFYKKYFWNTYEALATLLLILIMLLKIFINDKVTTLRFKKMFVSFPSEIVFLVIGFLFSDMISTRENEINKTNLIVVNIIIALIILVILYAIEKWLDDKLSGKLKKSVIVTIVLMYFFSITLYICIVL